MDAATIAAVAAAITSRLTARSVASAALAIALEDSKASLRILTMLAKAVRKAMIEGDYLPALISAGDRMMIYNDINKEYVSAFEAAMDLHIMETALRLTTEEKACREYGPDKLPCSERWTTSMTTAKG